MGAEAQAVRMRWDVRIPMRDGTRLSATLYLPADHSEASPALFTLTPYVAQVSHDVAVQFAARGYPFLNVDVRGRGNSEGEFHANGSEACDGHDLIEWLARQPYCNGKVAMWGGSYSGYVQWAAASQSPPHLATIAPAASPFRGIDSPAPNNIFMPYRIQWLTLLGGRTSQDKMFADQSFWNHQFRRWFESGTAFRHIDTFLGNPSGIFQQWLSHPHQDAYWDRFNPAPEHYARMSLPILTITGCYDTNQLGALTHYREHLRNASEHARSRHYLVIGPWDHAGTRTPKEQFGGLTLGSASLLDLLELHLQWYAWTMQGGPKPPFLQKNVAYYVMGAEQWRYADTLAGITARHEELYLRSGGELTHLPGSASELEPDRYVYDPRDLSLAAIESSIDPASLVDQRLFQASAGRQLVYHSAPFEQSVEVAGFFRLQLWLSIDQPDTDFHVSIYEVMPNGGVLRLTADWLRARYRESLREEKLIGTREPLRFDFERFAFISRRIARGSRLRLIVGPLHSIHWQKNYNSGGAVSEETMDDARTVTVRLCHDDVHRSVLHVPIGCS